MDYSKIYENAKKAKTVKRVNPEFIVFEKEGATVVGAFIDRTEVPSQKEGEKGYYQYLFDGDKGPIKFHLGSIADGEIGTQFVKGCIYAITYKGKEQLAGGRSVNKFDCFEIEPPPEDTDNG